VALCVRLRWPNRRERKRPDIAPHHIVWLCSKKTASLKKSLDALHKSSAYFSCRMADWPE